MLKTLIIDDESHIRETLRILLKPYQDQIMIVGEAEDVNSALTLIDSCSPDLVFLDIHLKQGTSFDVLKGINYQDFKLVFITAYEQYAVVAFKYSAVNYLLKPVDLDDFKETVEERILADSSADYSLSKQKEVLDSNLKEINKIVLKTQEKIYIIPFNEIVHCEASQNYTQFYTINDKILVSKTLKEYEKLLPANKFHRVHQSHLVNTDFINNYDRSGFIELSNGDKIPVSSRKKEEVLRLFFS